MESILLRDSVFFYSYSCPRAIRVQTIWIEKDYFLTFKLSEVLLNPLDGSNIFNTFLS